MLVAGRKVVLDVDAIRVRDRPARVRDGDDAHAPAGEVAG